MKKLLILAVMLTTVLAGCGQKDNSTGTTNNSQGASGNKGTLTVGTSADFAPYEFHKIIDGKDTIVGFDIEIAKEIAKDAEAELKIEDMDFDSLLMALDTGKLDFVISGMNPTAERRESVDFSDIYYVGEQSVLVKKDAVGNFNSYNDLKGKKLGVQKGSLQEGIGQEVEGAQLTSLTKLPELIMELKTGRVDAVIVDKPVAEQYAATQNDITIATDVKFDLPEDETGYAIAVKKGNQELLAKINATIKRLNENGDIERFVVEANELVE
ncbi:lipoprotein [Paenibacillus sp. GCM10012307]|uniref:Transporter substrate-binding domain-containing protein n=1 Tax=Paenibacillus roseus TaxID=2798579 RepID=A0A934J1I0_9BACL|nr:transporter substrate-binding domain-containing protein [Paenibacillus roseus]MBJ6359854.1 transporter substrate-binding domain-containing protein [Paenibacillus roseus]